MNHAIKRKRRRLRQSVASETNGQQPRCVHCRRPQEICHCDLIPRIQNKTEIVIAQDISERSHPFNTARIVKQSLVNSKLIAEYSENIRRHSNHISPAAGLLYPSKSAIDLAEVPSEEMPQQLVLLDGTWNQAKRLYRNWPELHGLRHFKIQPQRPGNYRIRLEPDESSLSTIEAAVAALSHCEPSLEHLDQLIHVFETMVDRQLAHPSANYSNANLNRKPTLNIPAVISDPNSNLVVAYGEAEPLRKGSPKKTCRTPVYWVAKRLNGGESFQAAIQSSKEINDDLLDYFQLPASAFEHSLSISEFKRQFESFIGHDDTLVVYNQGSLRLLKAAGCTFKHELALGSVNFNPKFKGETLTQFFARNEIQTVSPQFPGRAGRRLANLITLIQHLRQLKESQQHFTAKS